MEMRRLIRIVEGLIDEAPIGDIHYLGGEEPASLRASDIGIINNPKAQAKIRRVLDKAPILIHLAFLNHPFEYHSKYGIGDPAREIVTPKGNLPASGIMTPEQFEQTYGHVIERDPEALTVVFGMNDGDDTRPLSPWMIAHRIGHALQEQGRERSRGVFTPLLVSFNKIALGLSWDSASMTINVDDLAHALGSWKSARETRLTSSGEFVLETFAQYLIKGRIIFNVVPDTIKAAMSLGSQRAMPKAVEMHHGKDITLEPGIADRINAQADEWRIGAEKWFRDALRDAVGKLIVL
jgi:hypothetical protein